jgi:hypothetical protein
LFVLDGVCGNAEDFAFDEAVAGEGEAFHLDLYLLTGADEPCVLVLDESFNLQAAFGGPMLSFPWQQHRVRRVDHCAQ